MNKFYRAMGFSYSFLVTGGAGFIGSSLVDYLLKQNAKVRVFDNLSNGKLENIKQFTDNPNFEFLEGDVTNLQQCRKAVSNIDIVLHQAALGSVPRSIENPIVSNDSNVTGFLNMLVAAKDAKVKKMVYAASSSTYGDSLLLPKKEDIMGKPLSPYAVTKYVNELYAEVFSKVYNFHTVGLRYFNVFGPKQRSDSAYAAVIPLFMDAAINNSPVTINGDGTQTRDFTYIDNVIQANIKAALSSFDKHEVFNVACGERTSINELWHQIKELTNSSSTVNYGKSRQGDVKDSLADITKAEELLDYHPKYTIKEGLKKTLDSFISQQKS